MTQPGMTYAEYQREVAAQRQRDADRFSGRDAHLDKPLYSASDGKRIRGAKPRLVIELDDAGMPLIIEYTHNNPNEARELAWAADNAHFAVVIRARDVQEYVTQRAVSRRMADKHAEEKRTAYALENPERCPVCGRRFRTPRGLAMHQSRSGCRR